MSLYDDKVYSDKNKTYRIITKSNGLYIKTYETNELTINFIPFSTIDSLKCCKMNEITYKLTIERLLTQNSTYIACNFSFEHFIEIEKAFEKYHSNGLPKQFRLFKRKH